MSMTFIQHTELGSPQANIEFNSIPSTFTDLLLVYSARSATGGGGVRMRFNGSTTGYSERLLYADAGSSSGRSANTSTQSGFVWLLSNLSTYTANTYASGQIYIPNYRSSVAKTISAESVTENNGDAAERYIDAGLWTGTDPITSIVLTNPDGNTAAGSSFTLYGITRGSTPGVTVS